MNTRTLAAALLVSLHLLACPALAQEEPADPPAISQTDARRIAIDNGVVRIESIALEDGVWAIDGRDAADGEVELDIDASDGHIVRLQRDLPDSAQIMR